MKSNYKQIIGTSLLSLFLSVTPSIFSEVNGATLTGDPPCDIAAAVFNPDYSACKGSYEQKGNPEDSATKLLNTDGIFGSKKWESLGKVDTNTNDDGNTYFSVSNLNSDRTTGTIVFNTGAIDSKLGASFTQYYELVVSLKAATKISLYKWNAPIWPAGTTAPYTIDWMTSGTAVNHQDDPQDLSNVTVFVRKKEIPEPGMVFSLGIFGLGLLHRKKINPKN